MLQRTEAAERSVVAETQSIVVHTYKLVVKLSKASKATSRDTEHRCRYICIIQVHRAEGKIEGAGERARAGGGVWVRCYKGGGQREGERERERERESE